MFGWQLQLFRFPNLHEYLSLANKLVDDRVHTTRTLVCIEFLSKPATYFLYFPPYRHYFYTSNKTCQVYDAALCGTVVVFTQSRSLKSVVDNNRYVIFKKHRRFSFSIPSISSSIVPTIAFKLTASWNSFTKLNAAVMRIGCFYRFDVDSPW